MRRALDRRLLAAEKAAQSKAPKFQIIRVTGGLPGPVRCAKIDGEHRQRLSGETVEQFEERLFAAAKDAKAKTLVIGGALCGCAWRTAQDFEAHLGGFRPCDDGEDVNEIAVEQYGDR